MKYDKRRLFPIVLVLLMFAVYKYREHQNTQLQVFEGETMGTTYHIKYLGKENYKKEIDSILVDFNNSVSTYIPSSEISEFNQNGRLSYTSAYFYPVILKSAEIFKNTKGAFDPTVMPLVNAWGFGFKNKENIDSSLIDSLVKFVNFNTITFDKKEVYTRKKGVMLDFSAIAKGCGADVIAKYLQSKKIINYMVEIGGEVVCSGKNEEGKFWRIGINNPKYEEEGGEKITQTIALNHKALATSGNYRNFYVDDNGIKRAHTINPKTGYPVQHTLLSASVKAKDCMTADGYATALMVLGLEESKKLATQLKDVEIYLIYEYNGNLETWSSDNFFGN